MKREKEREGDREREREGRRDREREKERGRKGGVVGGAACKPIKNTATSQTHN